MNPDDYKQHCKYCSAKPIAPGPHHANTCKRYASTIDLNSEEANRYTCKHCGVKPFVAGPHHKDGCKRKEGHFKSSTMDDYPNFINKNFRNDFSKNLGSGISPRTILPSQNNSLLKNYNVSNFSNEYLDKFKNIKDSYGSLKGHIDSFNNIIDSSGRNKGFVDQFGNVKDTSGNIKGYIDSYGNIKKN